MAVCATKPAPGGRPGDVSPLASQPACRAPRLNSSRVGGRRYMSKTPEPSSGKGSGLSRPPQREPPTLSAQVRRGALWSALSTLVLRLVTIAVTAVVAHILAPRDFGVFTVALTAYMIVSSLGELGIASCLVRADLDIDTMAPTMVTVSLTMSALFAGAMAASAPHIA